VAVIGKHGVVVSEVRVEASPETVFDFFSRPEKMLRWMGVAAESDPRPGGAWRVDMNGQGWVAAGEIAEAEPPNRLVLTWGWEGPGAPVSLAPGASTVEVTFTRDGDATLVRMEHRDLPPDLRVLHGIGWEHSLARLAVAAAGGDPGPDPLASIRDVHELATLRGDPNRANKGAGRGT
jgi:uncharacterized protein YndB with AHSA1/START domain